MSPVSHCLIRCVQQDKQEQGDNQQNASDEQDFTQQRGIHQLFRMNVALTSNVLGGLSVFVGTHFK
jgi:hypothetical protein